LICAQYLKLKPVARRSAVSETSSNLVISAGLIADTVELLARV
jgi:hypothetical protein